MKYIAKTLTDAEGYDVTCHVALSGGFNLAAASASLSVSGYKDVAAFNAGKAAKMTTAVPVDLTTLTTTCGDMPTTMTVFDALWAVMATRLISDEASPFLGGTIEDSEST